LDFGKAFQELLRAARHALEEAYVLTALLSKEHKIKSNDTLTDFLKPFQAAGCWAPVSKIARGC
jgi:hypothetical protein